MNRRGYLFVLLAIILGLIIDTAVAGAQVGLPGEEAVSLFLAGRSSLGGGLGITRIDVNGEPITYYTLSFQPELSFGKVGIGLDVELLINREADPGGSRLRKKDLKFGKLVRYIRYGRRGDPFFGQLGALTQASLGHGFILYRYNNQVADEDREFGLQLGVDGGKVGAELLVSNLARSELFGGRVYLRPLRGVSPIPLVGGFAIGATVVTDRDPSRGLGRPGILPSSLTNRQPTDAITIYGLDAELPLINALGFTSMLYADYAKIRRFGSGATAGIGAGLKGLGNLFNLSGRLEYRRLGNEFLAEFFNTSYEVNAFVAPNRTKLDQLVGLKASKGVFGQLGGHILNQVEFFANYQAYADRDSSGVLHAEARLNPQLIHKIRLRASYDKQGLTGLKQIKTLDNRSVATVEVGYQLNPYILLLLQYRWTFAFDDQIRAYRPQERFTPQVRFTYQF